MMAFLLSPLGKLLGALALIVALYFGARHVAHNVLEDARAGVRQEYLVRDLKQAAKDAEADRLFAVGQQAKAEAQAAELRASLSTAIGKIKQSSTVIHERVASGELKDGQLSPVVAATIEQVDALETARKAK